MNWLAFDTSSSACSVALQINQQVYCLHEVAPMQQAKLLLPMIQSLLDQHAVKVSELDAIVYGNGPGSFTGMRIAKSVAEGLSLGRKVKLVPVSSMAVIAQTAYMDKQWAKLAVALDAHMGQLYWACYQANEKGWVELVGQEEHRALDALTIPGGTDWYGVGDAWGKFGDALTAHLGFQPLARESQALPNAKALLALAIANSLLT